MDNTIRVSPICGEDVLYVRCFEIRIEVSPNGKTVLYCVFYKGYCIKVLSSIKEAVEFCRE